MSPDGLQASIEKMRAEGVGDAAIDTFAHYYEQLREGASGMLPESRYRARRGPAHPRRAARGRPRDRSTQRSCSSSTAAWGRAWA